MPVLAAKGWKVVASNATMYLWVAIPTGEPAEAVAERLLPHGLLISPGTFFGPSGEGYIRFALVPTLDECERAAVILRRSVTHRRDVAALDRGEIRVARRSTASGGSTRTRRRRSSTTSASARWRRSSSGRTSTATRSR